MMGMLMYYLFLIPLIFMGYWWGLMLMLMFGFFVFLNQIWFKDFFCMVSYNLGGDLLSMCMIFLSVWIILLMILASFSVYSFNNYYFEFMFIIYLLFIFLFLSFSVCDLFMFYLFFESSLIPTMLLILGWGYQPERLTAGFYFMFYTLVASLPLLISIFFIKYNYFCSFYFLLYFGCNFYLYFFMILAFLVKMPLVFVHFWLPSAHVEAPVSGSMILAGVLLKLGGYGLMRVFMFFNNLEFKWNYFFISLSMYGSVIVGILCLYQTDIKSLIAYSSVAHMALVISGIFICNYWGLYGALILMIGHGLCSSGLFCLAGVIYEKVHSRSFIINKGLIVFMPSLSLFWFILSVNNMASPVSLNLMGEIMLIIGILGWSSICLLFLGLLSFFSCCYSIYLYSYLYHGNFYSGFNIFSIPQYREYLVIFFHLIPLNLLILKSDIFILWF
uniref:NADH-ubiquinone oxidoreductase chain 4 n=1 Tax=Opistoplatys sp. HL-2013 TaxID=1347747 RepID=A0A7I6HEM0_9HEMI|nr:NADH dehydrogenase subunit 4 [Opistoplatys sp. HL-2013]